MKCDECIERWGVTANKPMESLHPFWKMLDATPDNLKGIREKTLLLITYDSICRRSEIKSLRVLDIQIDKAEDQTKIKSTTTKK